MADTKVADKPKSGKGGLLVWVLLALVAGAGGATVPWVIGGKHSSEHSKKPEAPKRKSAAILFGDVVVNLSDPSGKGNRYLRVKILVAVDESDLKEVTDLVTKEKAFLKNWLIGYLSSQSSEDVWRKLGVNRIRREICDEFNARLYPNGEEKVVEILFDEFVVQ
jgi:flagellar basal body-associated protein FliL